MIEEVKIEGLTELREVLQRMLPEKLQGKALQAALGKAARPIVATARSLAPVKTGRLRKAIYSYRDRQSTPKREARLISVRRGKREQKRDRDAYYWKYVEFGRAAIEAKGGKVLRIPTGTYTDVSSRKEKDAVFTRRVKAVPARPFMRPAFEQNKSKALQIVQDELKGEIEKVAKRAQTRSASRLTRALRKTTAGI